MYLIQKYFTQQGFDYLAALFRGASLTTDHKDLGSIPGSDMGFSLIEMHSTLQRDLSPV